MMAAETRVVLVKPGDVLIFGNVGEDCDPEGLTDVFVSLKQQLGLESVMAFEQDIDLAMVPGGGA